MEKSIEIKRWLWLAIRLTVSIGLLWWLWSTCQSDDMRRVWNMVNLAPFVFSIIISIGGVAFSSIPWQFMLRSVSINISWSQAIVLNFLSFGVNNFMPGGLGGDGLRAWISGRLAGRYLEPIATVLLDRWISFFCLFAMAVLTMAFYWTKLCEAGLDSTMGLVLLVFIGLSIMSLGLLAGKWTLFQKISQKIAMGVPLVHLSDIIADLVCERKLMAKCFVLTLSTPILDAFIFYIISEQLQLEQPFWVYMLMVPAMRVIHHIPISINAVGTQDAACLFYLSALGVGNTEALAVSLSMHMIKLLSAGLCGILYMIGAGKIGVKVKKIPKNWEEARENCL